MLILHTAGNIFVTTGLMTKLHYEATSETDLIYSTAEEITAFGK